MPYNRPGTFPEKVRRLEQQKADLLAALKDILSPSVIERLEYDDDCIAVSVPNGALTRARAAIERAS